MRVWLRLACLGYFESIDFDALISGDGSDREITAELEALREALSKVLPIRDVESGFEPRAVRADTSDALLDHIQTGRYQAKLNKMCTALWSNGTQLPALTPEERGRIECEKQRLSQEQAVASDRAHLNLLWQLRQLKYAVYLEQQIEDHFAILAGVSEDAYLQQAENLAHDALKRYGIHISPSQLLCEKSQTYLSYIPPEQSNSVVDYENGTWTVSELTIDEAPSSGMFLAAELLDPHHALYETSVGHAISVFELLRQLDVMRSLVTAKGIYRPSKRTVTEHMHEFGEASFRLGRHVERLLTSEHLYSAKANRNRQQHLKAQANAKRGTYSEETRRVLQKMLELQSRGQSVTQSARLTFEKSKLGSSVEANRKSFARFQKRVKTKNLGKLAQSLQEIDIKN